MTIHVDKELEWDPFVRKINGKLEKLEEKIELVLSDLELIIRTSNKKAK